MFLNALEPLDTDPILSILIMAIAAAIFLLGCQVWKTFVFTKPPFKINEEVTVK